MEIKIPNYFWFSNCKAAKGKKGHPYTGSAGADPVHGCMKRTTLSFTVVLKTLDDDSVVFSAECWREQPWVKGKGKEKTDHVTAEFPDSEESIALIAQWLSEQYALIPTE